MNQKFVKTKIAFSCQIFQLFHEKSQNIFFTLSKWKMKEVRLYYLFYSFYVGPFSISAVQEPKPSNIKISCNQIIVHHTFMQY